MVVAIIGLVLVLAMLLTGQTSATGFLVCGVGLIVLGLVLDFGPWPGDRRKP
jgi:hypothetical protein